MVLYFNFSDLSLSLELTNALDWLVMEVPGVLRCLLSSSAITGTHSCTQLSTRLLGVRTRTFAFARPALCTLRPQLQGPLLSAQVRKGTIKDN